MLYTKEQLEKVIPHRFEMSLLDGIESVSDDGITITGVMNLTDDNWFFKGHFPGKPIMPGVLQLEALAQTGAVWILGKEEYKGKVAYFAGLDKVKFKAMVLPGDKLTLEVSMTKIKDMGERGAFGKGTGKAIVNGKIVTQCELSFFISE